MRKVAQAIAPLLVYLMVPASGGLTADLLHLLDAGHSRHADGEAEADASGGEGHDEPGPEHGCSGPYHHCPCHHTMSFDAPRPVRYEGEPFAGARLWVEGAERGADGHERNVERPPSA